MSNSQPRASDLCLGFRTTEVNFSALPGMLTTPPAETPA